MSDCVLPTTSTGLSVPRPIARAVRAAEGLSRDMTAIVLGAVSNLLGLAAFAVILTDGPYWLVVLLVASGALVGAGGYRLATHADETEVTSPRAQAQRLTVRKNRWSQRL